MWNWLAARLFQTSRLGLPHGPPTFHIKPLAITNEEGTWVNE